MNIITILVTALVIAMGVLALWAEYGGRDKKPDDKETEDGKEKK